MICDVVLTSRVVHAKNYKLRRCDVESIKMFVLEWNQDGSANSDWEGSCLFGKGILLFPY